MPLILVIEPESRSLERIADALGAEGFQVEGARDSDRAYQLAASRAPALVLVSTEVPGAESLLDSFGQRRGGPGSIALVSERQAAQAGTIGTGADAKLVRPFTDLDLRQAVRRSLAAARSGAPASDPAGHKLTSEEIFGDLLAELSNEGTGGSSAKRGRAQERAEKELDRKLEETLSGVLGPSRKPAPPPAPIAAEPPRPAAPSPAPAPPPAPAAPPAVAGAPPAPRPSTGATPPTAAAAPPKRARTGGPEFDALISRTLDELDRGVSKARAVPAKPARPPESAAPGPASAPAPRRPPAPPPAAPAPARPAAAAPPAEREASRPEAIARPAPASGTMPLPAVPSRRPAEAPAAERKPAPTPAPSPAPRPVAAAREVAAGGALATQRMPVVRPAGEPAGQQFGQYNLLEKIAVGGMAEVWKARMEGVEGFQKTVAIKKILPHLTDNSAFVTMFIDEAKLAAQLNHPNITHIYDLGKIGDDYYIAMEYVEGRNLRALLNAARRRAVKMPLGLALLIAARLASALDYAHRKKGFDGRELGLVHRDVSPQNVLISYDGDIKLCDFGIVKAVSKASHTQMGALKGKLQYMSPEQAWGKPVDGRSDLFSLGALLFETLTGRRLFPGDNEISVLEAVRECRVDSPRDLDHSIPPEIESLVAKALAKDPEDRYQSAGAMQQALEATLYALRPAPSQSELATFMHDLASAAEHASQSADEGPSVPSGPLPASGPRPASRSDVRAEARPEPPPELPPEISGVRLAPVRRDPTRPGSSAPASPPAEVAAVAPTRVTRVELEEGGSRGKSWLVAAIAALLVVGIGVTWVFRARLFGTAEGQGAEVGAEVPAETATADGAQLVEGAAPPSEGGGSDPASGEAGTDGADRSAAEAGGDAAATGAAPAVSVEQLVDAELERRKAEMQKKLEAEQRRLEQQLADAKAAEEKRRLEEEQGRLREAEEVSRREAEQRAAAEEEARKKSEAEQLARDQEATRQRDEAERQKAVEEEARRVKPGQLVEVGPGVVSPVLVSVAKPEYPPLARRLRVEGVVEVEVLVDENGSVSDARIVKSARQDVGMNESALTAARTARFQPATKDGVRVKVWYKLRIPFQL